MKKIFVTGISTDVGKTVVAAILTESLQADYWKPIQSGDLHYSDTHKVKELVSNKKSKFHKPAFELTEPMSPHAAAEIDNVQVSAEKINIPETENEYLVIEGAGGILVPINDKETILDLIPKDAIVVLVSKHYLGSINHTLMSIRVLRDRGYEPVVIFNGEENKATQEIIKKTTSVNVLGRLDFYNNLNKEKIKLLQTFISVIRFKL